MDNDKVLKDEDIVAYIDEYYFKVEISDLENRILYLLKLRKEKYPCKKNDDEWRNFSSWVVKRKIET